jgi:hypothetical protein
MTIPKEQIESLKREIVEKNKHVHFNLHSKHLEWVIDQLAGHIVPDGWVAVPLDKIKALEVLADAYEDADECDYCSDEYPEHEGCRPDEIANKFVRMARSIAAGQKEG